MNYQEGKQRKQCHLQLHPPRKKKVKDLGINLTKDVKDLPWLVWLNGLSAGLQTKESLVRFLVRAHPWVVGQTPSWGCARGNCTLMYLSLPSLLSKN